MAEFITISGEYAQSGVSDSEQGERAALNKPGLL